MAITINFPNIFSPFYRMFSGGQLNKAFWNPVFSSSAGITALAGGAQTGAPVMNACINEVDTVATGNDSVQLPIAVASAMVVVSNQAASNALQIFSNQAGTDTINGTAGSTGISLAAGDTAIFFCPVAGKWVALYAA
jgi:hypothetical protein